MNYPELDELREVFASRPPPVTPLYGDAVSFACYLLASGEASGETAKWAANLIAAIAKALEAK